MDNLRQQFLHPSDEFSPIPLWFWNDALTHAEIVRQMHAFRDKGVMGFVIHPRIGIPSEIGYLSDAFLDLVEAAVVEAERLGMTVFLYDEAMYPSGSAHGMVVQGHPEYATRGLRMAEYACEVLRVVPPLLEQGGFLAGCDHGVPPDITWPSFVEFTRLLAQAGGWYQ